jgi:hypothetical protein
MDAKLAFTQHHIALSFENPNNVPTPPRIDHYKLQFIKIGDNEKWPGRDDGHWVDHHPVYHITEDRPRMARQKITYGFIIETGDTGEFPLTVELLADGVGITNHLDFQVEDRHRPSVKCTKHLDCWVLPNPLPQ